MPADAMGRTESPQAEAIAELYLREGADAMRRRVLETGVIRVTLTFADPDKSETVWHVFRNGVTRQVEI